MRTRLTPGSIHLEAENEADSLYLKQWFLEFPVHKYEGKFLENHVSLLFRNPNNSVHDLYPGVLAHNSKEFNEKFDSTYENMKHEEIISALNNDDDYRSYSLVGIQLYSYGYMILEKHYE